LSALRRTLLAWSLPNKAKQSKAKAKDSTHLIIKGFAAVSFLSFWFGLTAPSPSFLSLCRSFVRSFSLSKP
jgi:hypothetical protein